MRLTIITVILAFGALTACNPLNPPVQFDQSPVEVNVPESDPCEYDVTLDACAVIIAPVPPVDTVPPVEGCDVTLGGTYDATTDTCEYIG